jgi:hypothetical protein
MNFFSRRISRIRALIPLMLLAVVGIVGIPRPAFAQAAQPQLLQALVSYQNGVFTVNSVEGAINGNSSLFTHLATGKWVLDLTETGIIPTGIAGAWANVLENNSENVSFVSDVHLVPAGGPKLDIYALSNENGSFAYTDDMKISLLIAYY